MSEEDFQRTVTFEAEQAVSWIEANISNPRQKAEAYYEGATSLRHEPGRSAVTVSVVRDAIHGILPSIGRIFSQTDVVGEFSSDEEIDETMCQEITLFTNSIYDKYDGYKALIVATTDALKSRVGVVKVRLERTEIGQHSTSGMLTDDEIEELQDQIQDGEYMITEISGPMEAPGTDDDLGEIMDPADMVAASMGTPGAEQPMMAASVGSSRELPMVRQVVLTKKSFRNKWFLTCVAPETLIVDAQATCVEDARIIGVRRNMAIYEAMAMGFPYDELEGYSSDDSAMLQEERFNRLRFDPNDYTDNYSNDPTTKRILITEAWIRIDADGDQYAELRHIVTAGPNYDVLLDEVVQHAPLAVFITDLQPHVFFPISVAEDLIQDADALTTVTRSILDNVALVNSPQRAVNETQVNLEDAKNSEIGAIIRVKQMGQIEELTTPFVAGETLTVLQYLHQNSESRSGVTKLSQGIDPNALQATSRIAANAAVTGGDARIEMMARNIAETGVKQLFVAILRTAMYELKGPQSIKTPTGYRHFDPSKWHDQINVSINVGLGNGRIEEKQATLQSVIMAQQQVMQTLGLTNPLCGWENIRNSFKMVLRLSGIKNVGDFFPFVPPAQVKAFDDQQKAQAAQAARSQQPPVPDLKGAAEVKAQADVMINDKKIQAQSQADIQKIEAEAQKTIAQLQQAHTLEIQSLRAEQQNLMAQLSTKANTDLTIAAWKDDQARDEANQKYAVDAYKVQLDDATKRAVAVENATNDVGAQ